MRLKVHYKTLNTLTTLKGKYMLNDAHEIVLIEEIEYEKVTETPEEKKAKSGYFIRKKDRQSVSESKEVYYITKCVMRGWHHEGNFLGVFFEDFMEKKIKEHDDPYYTFNFYNWRKAWVKLEGELKGFGFKIEYPVEDTTCHCDDPIVQQDKEGKQYCTKCEMTIPFKEEETPAEKAEADK